MKKQIARVAARPSAVGPDQFFTRQRARIPTQKTRRHRRRRPVARLPPVRQSNSQIRKRIADRRHFPIKDARYRRHVFRTENEIVELEVVVNDDRARIRG